MRKLTSKSARYVVTQKGGRFLTTKQKVQVTERKYTWAKTPTKAARLSYDAARKAALRYAGKMVRVA